MSNIEFESEYYKEEFHKYISRIKNGNKPLYQIRKQTEEICWDYLLDQGWYQIRYVKNPTKAMCWYAIKESVVAISYMRVNYPAAKACWASDLGLKPKSPDSVLRN